MKPTLDQKLLIIPILIMLIHHQAGSTFSSENHSETGKVNSSAPRDWNRKIHKSDIGTEDTHGEATSASSAPSLNFSNPNSSASPFENMTRTIDFKSNAIAIRSTITISMTCLSFVSLSVLICVYATNRSLRAKLPSKNLIALCFVYCCEFLMIMIGSCVILLVAIDYFENIAIKKSNRPARVVEIEICDKIKPNDEKFTKLKLFFVLIGTIIQYLNLSKFAWITIISYSMYRTFSKQSLMSRRSSRKEDNRRKFRLNLIIGFAIVPLVFVSPLIIIQMIFPEYFIAVIDSENEAINVTKNNNALNSSVSFQPVNFRGRSFILLPISFMMVLNLVFFVLVVLSIMKNRSPATLETSRGMQRIPLNMNQTRRRQSGPRVSTRIGKFKLFMKFQIIMGFNWFAFIMAAVFRNPHLMVFYWIIGILQGFLLTLTFLFNESVRKAIRNS